jgi:GNAT superfamily N-acetyltransferase
VALVDRFYGIDHHPFDESRVRSALGPLLVDDRTGLVWLIEVDEGTAGYAVVTWGHSLESGGRDALLDELFVADPGHGVGHAAMAEILTACTRHGARRVFLETERPNQRARRFYARLGFETDDSIWMSRWL